MSGTTRKPIAGSNPSAEEIAPSVLLSRLRERHTSSFWKDYLHPILLREIASQTRLALSESTSRKQRRKARALHEYLTGLLSSIEQAELRVADKLKSQEH